MFCFCRQNSETKKISKQEEQKSNSSDEEMSVGKNFQINSCFSLLFSEDIEMSDEENEEEIIRRQRLRREQLKQVEFRVQRSNQDEKLVRLEIQRKRVGR